jgi:co-chaperonin GroES (HSP10)
MNWDPDFIEMIGDKVLIEPHSAEQRTGSGLYLPPGVKDKEPVRQGIIVKVGPGYMLPSDDMDEEWKPLEQRQHYMPLQVEEGQWAVFLKNAAWEVRLDTRAYYIVPQSAILMVYSDLLLDDLEDIDTMDSGS